MNENSYKKRIIFMSISLVVTIFIISIGVTYSYFAVLLRNLESSSTVKVDSGSVSFSFDAGTNNINGSNVTPGWSGSKYFSVTTVNNTSKSFSYNINIVVDSSNFSTSSGNGANYLQYNLYTCTALGSDCSTTATRSGVLNTRSGIKNIYSVTVSKSNAGTKYYSLVINYPNDLNYVQSQYGYDGEVLHFAGHVTIDSTSQLTH